MYYKHLVKYVKNFEVTKCAHEPIFGEAKGFSAVDPKQSRNQTTPLHWNKTRTAWLLGFIDGSTWPYASENLENETESPCELSYQDHFKKECLLVVSYLLQNFQPQHLDPLTRL